MTKQRIEKYVRLRREIGMLDTQIYLAQDDEYVADVVQNDLRRLVIRGYGSRAIPRLCARRARYEAECDAIESFIEELEDSIMRQILTHRYIVGHTFEQTGELVGYSDRSVKRKVRDFFEKMSLDVTECP